MSKSTLLSFIVSRIAPVLLAVILLGVIGFVTITNNSMQADLIAQRVHKSDTAAGSGRPHQMVIFSLSYLPANALIESKQIALRDVDKLEVWDDAEVLPADVIGKTPARSIPENAQIRKGDLR